MMFRPQAEEKHQKMDGQCIFRGYSTFPGSRYECPYFKTGRYEDIGKDDKKYKIRGGTEMQVTEA